MQNGCCTLCGVPHAEAPDLFGESREGCYVKKQPSSADEIDRMISAMAVQELGCIRYKGTDPDILARLSTIDGGVHIVSVEVGPTPKSRWRRLFMLLKKR